MTDDAVERLPVMQPCQVCGGQGVLRMSRDGDVEWVRCLGCKRDGPVKMTASEAIDAWNSPVSVPEPHTNDRFAGWLKAYVGAQDANKMRFSVAELRIAFGAGETLSRPIAPDVREAKLDRVRDKELDELAGRVRQARSGKLTGIACEHGWDTSVCPIRGCGLDEDELVGELLEHLKVRTLRIVHLPDALASPVAGITQEDFLAQLRRINTDRYHAWVGDGGDAGILFDAVELGGEVGELLNVVKKLVREEQGWRGSRAQPEDFANECADVLICLDKLARRRGVDLAAATVAKFNATSEEQGFPHILALLTPSATVDREVGR